ncbi:hypothetical protein GCM10010293_32460 [Streptomyces griseoflavus]|uniref:hypothetical protein n=1 Tax=Streptomyces griseoflavus TaxID=35619 RepID=UPI00167ECD4E|nr:hypothetical protein [Streptomyces griseoflavus]GGV31530.1 hypothetical protein GCM10010293_32460 [Streptomyces griseoflavus]
MPSQKKPPTPDGPDATGGPSVRRAVSLGSAAADPGPMPAPAARRAAAPEPDGRDAEAPEPARPAPGTAGSAAAAVPSAASDGTDGEAAEKSATPDSAGEPDAAARAEPDGGTRGAARAAGVGAAGAAGGADATPTAAAAAAAGADGPPSGKPKKPLLAAAGIAGVVLLSVPLLIWATDDSRQKKDDVAVAAGADTLLEEDPLEVPKGDYAPAEPTPEPSTRKPSAEPKKVVEKAPPAVSSTAPAGESPGAKEKKTEKAEPRVEKREAPVLPPNTAAYAVQRLAASNPGRHICYRVHRKGAGWTNPRCDGAMSGKGLPITAINIAVVGAKRVSANEYVQKDGWTTPWSGAADGTDLTLGSDSPNAPNLSGYAIGVDDGNVCHHHKLGGHDWGAYLCESSQGWRFGGSLNPDVWLESVKFNL